MFIINNPSNNFATCVVLKIGEYHLDNPQFSLRNTQSGNAFRPIMPEQKYLVDYKQQCGIVTVLLFVLQ